MIGFDLGNRCQCSKTFGRHCIYINNGVFLNHIENNSCSLERSVIYLASFVLEGARNFMALGFRQTLLST